MIDVFPLISFLAFSNNTNQNGFNYVSRFNMNIPVTVFEGANNNNEQLNVSGFVYIEGDFYCNNSINYMFDFDTLGFSINYYVNFVKQNYGSYASTDYNYVFTNSLTGFNFGMYFNTNSNDRNIGLLYDNSTQYIRSAINGDFYADHIYDVSYFEDYLLDYQFTIDFSNNSVFIDLFHNAINTGLRANIDNASIGYDIGYEEGFKDAKDEYFEVGWAGGFQEGYDNGYTIGLNDGLEYDDAALTIFSGILAVGILPINVFLAFFNFEVLGINFTELVSSLLSVCVCVIIIKKTFSTNGGD